MAVGRGAMLKKHVDMALVGKSYLSVLLSLNLLEQNQDVLLLDDERMGVDDFYVERFFSLEKEYLFNWGQEQNIAPLLNIEKYLTNVSSKFVFDDIHIHLGESPAHNYRELCRKMPEVFLPSGARGNICESAKEMEEFNDIYFEYCKSLGKFVYSRKNTSASNLNFLEGKCPIVLKNIYDDFERAFQNKKYGKSWLRLKTFLYMSQGVFQKKLSMESSPLENFHLFLCLLSPFYELDRKKFFEDIIAVNLEKGGEFKKTSINEWTFHKGKPWSVELASYEGIIHPKKMAFVGGIPHGNLVALRPEIECYTSLGIELDFSESPVGSCMHERIIFSGIDKLGSSFPFWEGTFDEKGGVFRFIIFAERGRKADFVKEKVKMHLFRDIECFIPKISKIVKDVRMTYGRDVWIDKTKSIPKKANCPVSLVDFSKPEKGERLKDVYYFGSYGDMFLGHLGTFMEISRQLQFM